MTNQQEILRTIGEVNCAVLAQDWPRAQAAIYEVQRLLPPDCPPAPPKPMEFDHEVDCAKEAHRRGNAPSCWWHLMRAVQLAKSPENGCSREQFVLRYDDRVQLTFINSKGQYELVRDGLPNTITWEHPQVAEELRKRPDLDAGRREMLRVYDLGPLKPEVSNVRELCLCQLHDLPIGTRVDNRRGRWEIFEYLPDHREVKMRDLDRLDYENWPYGTRVELKSGTWHVLDDRRFGSP